MCKLETELGQDWVTRSMFFSAIFYTLGEPAWILLVSSQTFGLLHSLQCTFKYSLLVVVQSVKMLCKYCQLILLIVAVNFQQSGCAKMDPDVIGAGGNDTIANDGVERIKEASSKGDDMWNMVASMRDSGGGSSRMASIIKSYSSNNKNIELDWSINLDALGYYQLSWQANVSSNQVVFALNIDTNRSRFHIGTDIFALGFSERGQLNSSDFCLIWYDLSHRLHLQDAITNSDNTLQLVDSAESACRPLNIGHTELIGRRKLEDEEQSGVDTRTGTSSNRIDDSAKSMDSSKNNLEIIFSRPLEVCKASNSYYLIDSGTTHLVWFALRGPLLALDGLNLSEALQRDLQSVVGQTRETKNTSNHHSDEHSGMRRVQLIATKPSSSSSLSNELASGAQSQSQPSPVKSVDILMDKYEIPPKETTYLCKLIKLPSKFQLRRYHITSYEAVIEAGNEHVVHHMELFNCANLSDQSDLDILHQSGGWSGECSSTDRPRATESCKRVILAWAMGAKPLVYPEQVGQSIGGPNYSAYVMLEVHYNNVAQSSGLIDSSGLRFHYSSHLRAFDAGVLEVGLEYTDKNSIPPGMLTPLAGYCVSECTRAAMSAPGASGKGDGDHDNHRDRQDEDDDHHRARRSRRHHRLGRRNGRPRGSSRLDEEDAGGDRLNSNIIKQRQQQQQQDGQTLEEGIYVFAAQMHTHLTGVASWTEHVREGRLIGELQRDNHYSPHFQEIRLLPEPVHIAPGDALVHYCLYDTRQRLNVTLGGFATTDEMCVTYLHYYPKIDLEVCKSSVETAALSNYFANLARDEGQPTSALLAENDRTTLVPPAPALSRKRLARELSRPAVKGVSDNYRSIDWSRRRSRELIEFYNNAPLSVQCNRSDGRRWPGHWNGITPTQLIENGGEEDDVDKVDTAESVAEPHLAVTRTSRKSARQLVDYRGLGAARRLTTHCKRQLARYSDYDFL